MQYCIRDSLVFVGKMKETEEHLQTEAERILKHTWQTAVSLQTPKAASELQLQCPTCTAGTECSNRKRSSHCWSVFSVGKTQVAHSY